MCVKIVRGKLNKDDLNKTRKKNKDKEIQEMTPEEKAIYKRYKEGEFDDEKVSETKYDSFQQLKDDIMVQPEEEEIKKGQINTKKKHTTMRLDKHEQEEEEDETEETEDDDDSSYTVYSYTSSSSKTWDIGEETHTECPKKEEEPTVIINKDTKDKIKSLMDVMDGDEWLAMLVGKELEEHSGYYIWNIEVPKQVVTAANAEKEEPEEPDNCLGVIHSHHDMGTFWSSTDEKHSIDNNELSIVVDSNLNSKAAVRKEAECGRKIQVEADVIFDDDDPDYLDWAKDMKEKKIKKKKYKRYNRSYSGIYGGYGGYGGYGNNFRTDKDEDEEDEEGSTVSSGTSWKKSPKSKDTDKDEDEEDDRLEDVAMNDIREVAELIRDCSDIQDEPLNLDRYILTHEMTCMIVDKTRDNIPNIIYGNDIPFRQWLNTYAPNFEFNWHLLSNEERRELIKDYIMDMDTLGHQVRSAKSDNVMFPHDRYGLKNGTVPKSIVRLDEENFEFLKYDEEVDEDEDND